eukprot:2546458-Rhodomonas_salina.2
MGQTLTEDEFCWGGQERYLEMKATLGDPRDLLLEEARCFIISPRSPYAMSGTDIAYGALPRALTQLDGEPKSPGELLPYVYAMPGTDTP